MTIENEVYDYQLLIEETESYFTLPQKPTGIDRVGLGNRLLDFIEEKNMRFSVEAKVFFNLSATTLHRITYFDTTLKEETLQKVFLKLMDAGALKLPW